MVGNSDAKVILLVIDDLDPNALEETRTPNLDVLIRAGSATMEAETGNLSPRMLPLFNILTGRKPPGSGAVFERSACDLRSQIQHHQSSSYAGLLNCRLYIVHSFPGLCTMEYSIILPLRVWIIRDDAHKIITSAADDIISFNPICAFCIWGAPARWIPGGNYESGKPQACGDVG